MASFLKNVVLDFFVVVYMKEVNLFLQTFPSNSPILYLDRFLLELSIDPKWL